jgi:hypothetical protein
MVGKKTVLDSECRMFIENMRQSARRSAARNRWLYPLAALLIPFLYLIYMLAMATNYHIHVAVAVTTLVVYISATAWSWYCFGPWLGELRRHIAGVLGASGLLMKVLEGNQLEALKPPSWVWNGMLPPPDYGAEQSQKYILADFLDRYIEYAKANGVKAYPAKSTWITAGYTTLYILLTCGYICLLNVHPYLNEVDIVYQQTAISVLWVAAIYSNMSHLPERFALVEVTAEILLDDEPAENAVAPEGESR